MADRSFHLKGSVFWVGQDLEGNSIADPVDAVTARHVVDNIRRTGVQFAYLRINQIDGRAVWVETLIDDWYQHPTDSSLDVAILKMGLHSGWDDVVIPYSLCITDELMLRHEVVLGDEVFITGLFRHHHGSGINIPIVRVGNLSCISEERIQTKDFGPIDAFLIEARSIGGLSGSPVFLNLGITRMIEGQRKHSTSGPIVYLMGLIHGHYDVAESAIDSDDLTHQQINTGIAITVPMESIRSVIKAFEHNGS